MTVTHVKPTLSANWNLDIGSAGTHLPPPYIYVYMLNTGLKILKVYTSNFSR